MHTPCLEEWIVGLLVFDHRKKRESSIMISSGFYNAVQSEIGSERLAWGAGCLMNLFICTAL